MYVYPLNQLFLFSNQHFLFDFQREKRSHDYFPFERALALTNQEEDQDHVTSALENVTRKIEFLVQKSKEHVSNIFILC